MLYYKCTLLPPGLWVQYTGETLLYDLPAKFQNGDTAKNSLSVFYEPF